MLQLLSLRRCDVIVCVERASENLVKMNVRDNVMTLRKPPEENSIRFEVLNGENTVLTTYQMTKAATICGAAASVSHLVLFYPKNLANGAMRAANITGTFALMGAVFGMATNVSASVREKDDAVNYFTGGCAAGVMLGARMRSIGVGTGSCVAFGSWGAFYKYWMDRGYGKFIKPPIY